MTGPNQVCILFVTGVLASYAALLIPKGWIVFLIGLACVLTALVRGAAYPMRPIGVTLLAAAIIFFVLELYGNVIYVYGIVGTVVLAFGFVALYSGPERITAAIAMPGGLTLGLVTTVLCATAKRARINKRSA